MTDGKRSFGEFWSALWRQPRRWWLLGIPAGGVLAFAVGILFWGGFNWTLELTNTEAFCISCHEMRDFVYQEYRESPHFSNGSGVRATCPDCHVPRKWEYKVMRKAQATFKELPRHVLGKINTREKFEAHRLELARHVWAGMEATDSRECRNCHSSQAMDLALQGKSAARKHSAEWRQKTGDTCIDCHKGIAHELPDIPSETAAESP